MKKKLILFIALILTMFFGKTTAYPTLIAHSDEDPPFFSDDHYEEISVQNIEVANDTINVELSEGVE